MFAGFAALCPTWPLVGEERQVHTRENFVDPPEFAADAFAAEAWLGAAPAPASRLAADVDIPWGRADLYHVAKLAIAAAAANPARQPVAPPVFVRGLATSIA